MQAVLRKGWISFDPLLSPARFSVPSQHWRRLLPSMITTLAFSLVMPNCTCKTMQHRGRVRGDTLRAQGSTMLGAAAGGTHVAPEVLQGPEAPHVHLVFLGPLTSSDGGEDPPHNSVDQIKGVPQDERTDCQSLGREMHLLRPKAIRAQEGAVDEAWRARVPFHVTIGRRVMAHHLFLVCLHLLLRVPFLGELVPRSTTTCMWRAMIVSTSALSSSTVLVSSRNSCISIWSIPRRSCSRGTMRTSGYPDCSSSSVYSM